MPELCAIIESLLFVSSEPVSMDRLRAAVPEADPAAIKAAIAELEAQYEARGGGFSLRRVAGGFQLRTRPELADWIRRFLQAQPMRLSRAALETLAIIAYKQPVLRSDIEHVRGVDSGGVLRFLMEKKLVRVLGRKDLPGRPMIYATTRKFLELFDLKDLSELPSLKDVQELVKGSGPGKGEASEEDLAPEEGSLHWEEASLEPEDLPDEDNGAGEEQTPDGQEPQDT